MVEARRSFFDGRPVPQNVIPLPILDSWRRCNALGLNNSVAPHLEPLTAAELRPRSEQHETLRRLCRPEIEALHAEADSTDCIVILTDATGLVLDTVGDVDFADRAARVALRPGVPWTEAATGTNAIGAALIEKRPIKVHGIQHFFEPHGFLSCSAAPIFDPRGEIAGALDMSGPAATDQRHALGLVRMAVDQIEHRFFDQGFARCETIRFHTDPGLVGTSQEGVLVFEDRRLVAGNRRGLALLGLDWSALKDRLFEDLFSDGRLHGDGFLKRLQAQDGDQFFARLQAPARPAVSRAGRGARMAARPVAPVFDPGTRKALARATRLIDADVPVLLHGETGTGKEIFARAMHHGSARADRPFVAVNSVALPDVLIREAAGGVLFLDEIGDMPLSLQSRLLRILQDREAKPSRGGRAVSTDFALVCTTHRDLRAMVATGSFRADLYFRIAQFTEELAPLRSLPGLAAVIRNVWLDLANQRHVTLSPETEHALLGYDWPGNFRQLVGTLRSLLALAEDGNPILPSMLPAEFGIDTRASQVVIPTPASLENEDRLRDVQLDLMRRVLAECDGNISRAAKRLGINRSTIYRHLIGTRH
ncbi:MAG: sigma-54-dependent Fis family transcriptional regulator [Proteobacteria bacterium]|nr:sigma-54-dependent Fis family transcriptional regulator [Pseudomonadota bacterium]